MNSRTATKKNARIRQLLQAERRNSDDYDFINDCIREPEGLDPALVLELWKLRGEDGESLDLLTEAWDAFEAATPAFREQLVPILAASRSLYAQVHAAAHEQGGMKRYQHVRGSLRRLEDIRYFGLQEFKHDRIEKLAQDRDFARAAIVGLHRFRFPEVWDEESDIPVYRLLWGLTSLVVLAGGAGAQEALESIVEQRKPYPEFVEPLALRLKAEASRPHVRPALERLAGTRKGPVPPLPAIEPGSEAATGSPAPAAAKQPMDPNLHLALLSALAAKGKVKLPRAKKGGDAPNEAVRAALLAITPKPEDLAALDTLTWEAGEDIQYLVWGQWDGEDDYFEITRLDGIEALSGLEHLDLELANVTDLAPLRGLRALKHVAVEGQVADLSPLSDLPRLTKLSVSADKTAANKKILAAVRARKARA
jgi:hypothetical protein